MFKELNVEKVTDAINLLFLRIEERFPTSNLLNVCNELKDLSIIAKANIRHLNKPYIYFRILFSLLIIITLGSLIYTVSKISGQGKPIDIQSFISTSEALLNELVMIGAAFLFI